MPKILYSSLDDLLYDNYINENAADTEVIQEVLNGNINAFAILVNKYEKMIYNLAFYKISNHEDAQDLTQEYFLRTYKILIIKRRQMRSHAETMKIIL